mgnify:CR=1 FL=1
MERMNENEVKEVARMQHIMMLSEKDIYCPKLTETDLDKEMNNIWRWVKKHKIIKQ